MNLNEAKKLITTTKETIKNEIVPLVVARYLKEHNNLYPNFENDEEFKIIIDHPLTFVIDVEDGDGNHAPELCYITSLIVALDENLFIHDENGDELAWDDLWVEDLYLILSYMKYLK
jgi:hypothetical protein